MTTTNRNYPTRVRMMFQNKVGNIALDQIPTVDKKRIIKVAGALSNKETSEVKKILKQSYVD